MLHLANDPDIGEILASELMTTEYGDASLVGALLDQISGPIASVRADGAYDGDPVYCIIANRDPAAAMANHVELLVPKPTHQADLIIRERAEAIVGAIGKTPRLV